MERGPVRCKLGRPHAAPRSGPTTLRCQLRVGFSSHPRILSRVLAVLTESLELPDHVTISVDIDPVNLS